MYNVLPEENQKSLKKEYILRLIAVASWFVGAIAFCGLVLLIPSYVITLQKKSELNLEIKQGGEAEANSSEANYTNTAKDLQEKLKTLAVLADETRLPHVFFDSILKEKSKDITLDRFHYELVGTTTTIILDGVAQTRDGLLSFKSRLEKTKLFRQVDFPIDLLVKTRNISFTMTLK